MKLKDLNQKTENTLRKLLVVVCIWIAIFSSVLLIIAFQNYFKNASDENLYLLMSQALVIASCLGIIYWNKTNGRGEK